MPNYYTLPTVPGHPEPSHMRWSELERKAIADYGLICSYKAREPLLAEIDRLRAEVEALRSGIEKAMSEIDDAGPKALKYARQELEATIAARNGEGSEAP